MQWITATLAFAVTMLIFAMVTSALVESVHRLLALRTAGLKLLLGNVFDHAIRQHLAKVEMPALKAQLDPALDANWAAARNAFVELMTLNRATQPIVTTARTGWMQRITHLVDRFTERFFGITEVPVEVFTQKLADPRFLWKGGRPADNVITDMAQKYEAFGREATTYFESRARLLSVIVAIPVAWLFFVHPYKLAVVYTKNPEVARAVADQATKISADYEALQQRVADGAKAADAKATDAKASEAQAKEVKAAVERLSNNLKDAAKQSKELAAAGVPLGWPTASDEDLADCNPGPTADGAKTVFGGACRTTWWGITWIRPTLSGALWLTIGGLLIGLGAPFWARAVSALTSARSGSWQRFAEIVGTPAGGTTRAGAGAGAGAGTSVVAAGADSAPATPTRVSNRTFDVAHAAANLAKQP